MFHLSPRWTVIPALLLSLGLVSANVYAETLTFKNILAARLQNSFDSKIVREEIQIAQARGCKKLCVNGHSRLQLITTGGTNDHTERLARYPDEGLQES
ncbi:hypothetical protein SAMN05660420_03353 [Desulfuromusa kysingii]|uniref:Uncharacterized protein n=1 Tax=Desulfuromusa kysingii TaxID=37625 RepID=A0A1H4EET7_9BACT|nr:hypothetical protein SAMN05660420_03353 [Desulfuromusa kysingii]